MSILSVERLRKHYPSFDLQDVSFSLAAGQITGFIGRNGAGKSTTLKSLLQFIQPDAGNIEFFGRPYAAHQQEIKQRIGFVAGGVDYYPSKRLRSISDTVRRFYATWDDAAYRRYLTRFQLDENKTPAQLSAGMKVKYALTLALSHHVELLLLDEPTSGLDPVSRDEALDILLELCEGGVTILFSTHITSDLDRCADRILYLQNGRLAADTTMRDFIDGYRLVALNETQTGLPGLIGCKRAKNGYTALVRTADAPMGITAKPADLTEIMVHLEKEALV